MASSDAPPSRRTLLKVGAGLAPFASQATPPPAASAGRLIIDRVKVYVTPMLPLSRFGSPNFSSAEDPKRWRWLGPFAQLAGSIIVEIGTRQGITGFGMGGGGAAAALIIEKHLRDFLIGSDASRVELLWDQMYSSTLFYGRRGVTIMALSGVDLALWDLIGRAQDKPVYQLLGGLVKTKVPAYFTGNDLDFAIRSGFQAIKIPITRSTRDGREGMRQTETELHRVRERIGPELQLMIDVNCQWDVPYTIEMLERLRPLKLAFIEEPVSPDDVLGYADICRVSGTTSIASGEHEYTRHGYRMLLHHKAVDILQPDLTWCGGLTEIRRVAAMASAENLPVVPHRGGSVYGLNFILATPNCPLAESFGIGEPENELLAAVSSHFENGHYLASEKPGFGHALSTALLEKHSQGAA
jgi:L-rhamnonate dehydratase